VDIESSGRLLRSSAIDPLARRSIPIGLNGADQYLRTLAGEWQKVAEGKFVYFHPSPKAGSGVARTILHFIVSGPSGHVIFRFRSAELRDAIRVRSAFPKLSAIHSKRTKSVPTSNEIALRPCRGQNA